MAPDRLVSPIVCWSYICTGSMVIRPRTAQRVKLSRNVASTVHLADEPLPAHCWRHSPQDRKAALQIISAVRDRGTAAIQALLTAVELAPQRSAARTRRQRSPPDGCLGWCRESEPGPASDAAATQARPGSLSGDGE